MSGDPIKRSFFYDLAETVRISKAQDKHRTPPALDQHQGEDSLEIDEEKKSIELIEEAIADGLRSYLSDDRLEIVSRDILRNIQDVLGGKRHYIPQPNLNAMRDEAIWLDITLGASLDEVSIRYGISTKWARVIYKRMCEAKLDA